mmetsp:Transcript_27784/g.39761  ORF Transcript_27784/g.39761 Transcript_27784/m.39761 type:complete len:119 (+) Transcript_27784:116-472(+)
MFFQVLRSTIAQRPKLAMMKWFSSASNSMMFSTSTPATMGSASRALVVGYYDARPGVDALAGIVFKTSLQRHMPADGIADLVALGRNTRRAKRANRGKRPCSNVGRRAKRRRNGNPRR